MKKFGDFICKNKVAILIVAFLLLIPAAIGMYKAKINYDILVYLPEDIETMKGQKILTDDFDMGAFSVCIVDNMEANDVLDLEDKFREIKGVNKVVSLYDVIGTTIPIEMLPDEVQEKVNKGDSALMMVTFNEGTSDKTTMNAVNEMRKIAKGSTKIGGMSAMVLDTRNLADQEILSYVCIAVALCIIVLMLSLDSYMVPLFLLLNIGMAIVYNMGSNFFDISYITKAISSVLQLGVTTDFSIFLYHKYEQEKTKFNNKNDAMSRAIEKTITSVLGSSLTTIAGFLALCTMTLTLGKDIGIVMAKGVLLGVISVVTIFPALILCFDKIITKTSHKPFLPEFNHVKSFIQKHYKAIFICFLVLLLPAWYGQKNTNVYYNLDSSLPDTLDSSIANTELKEKFNIVSPEIILVSNDTSTDDINEMIEKIEKIDGIDFALGASKLDELGIPNDFLSEELTEAFKSDDYQLIIVNSLYKTASNDLNNQIDKMSKIVKKYDKKAIIAGEGPLTKDLIEISSTDFNNVTVASLVAIFLLMLIVLKSISLPFILIAVIEFAIFINMGIPFYTGTTIPFVSSIVIGTIQLGATIDYAILMTNKYLEKRQMGLDKEMSLKIALDNSVGSIFVSGLCFFAATFGVGIYSKLEMISSLCTLISRGAIISMIVVIFVLPSFLLIFDNLICKTTMGFGKKEKNMKKIIKKTLAMLFVTLMIASPLQASALTKDETVYSNLNNDGTVKKTTVTEHLINSEKSDNISDITSLQNIKNQNGKEKFSLSENNITWNAKGKDIYYQGTTDKELPISTNITYKLNGETVNPKKIVNKSGDIEITYNFTNNEVNYYNGEIIYTPFVLTLSTTLLNKYNSDIEVTNGRVISTGTNSVIAAISTPGLYESLNIDSLKNLNQITIKYHTTKFQTNSVYLTATSKLLEESDLNFNYQISNIQTQANTLANSTNLLVEGSNKINTNLNYLSTNYSEFNKNITELSGFTNSLSTEYSTIDNGINLIYSNLESLNNMALLINKAKSGIAYAYNYSTLTKQNINDIVVDVQNTNTALNTHMNKLIEIANSTTDSNTKQVLLTEIGELKNNLMNNSAKTTTDLTNASYNIAYTDGTLETLYNNTKDVNPDLTTLNTGINSLYNGSKVYKSYMEKLNESMEKLSLASENINSGLYELSNGTNNLYIGLNKLNDEGIKKVADFINNNIVSTSSKIEELTYLANQYNTFTESNTNSNTKFIMNVSSIKNNK